MNSTQTPVNDLIVIEPEVYGDARGWFYESHNADKFRALGIDITVVQANHSFSGKGILRGLHFQRPPKAMAKLVRCTRGCLWDVAVDIRKDSSTYKKWFGIELSAENKKMLFVPEGFAHGFYALEECELQYLVTETYSKEHDSGIAWNDPDIGVDWRLDGEPLLSEKDQGLVNLSQYDNPF